MRWTKDRQAELECLAASGLTGSEIAQKMGNGLTRNAVLGRATRTGVKLPLDDRKRKKGAEAGTLRTLWESPEFRKMQSEKQTRLWQRPEYRANHSEMKRRYWSDPEARKRHGEALRRAHQRRKACDSRTA